MNNFCWIQTSFLEGCHERRIEFTSLICTRPLFFTHMHRYLQGRHATCASCFETAKALTHAPRWHNLLCIDIPRLLHHGLGCLGTGSVSFSTSKGINININIIFCFRDTHWIILSFRFTFCDPGNRIPEKIAFKVRKSQYKRAYFRNHLCSAPLVLNWA